MENNVTILKDFAAKKFEKKILEVISQSEEALSENNYKKAREFYSEAHNIYIDFGKEIRHISVRMNDLEEFIFYR